MRHKVFVNCHHINNQDYKNRLIRDFSNDFDEMVVIIEVI